MYQYRPYSEQLHGLMRQCARSALSIDLRERVDQVLDGDAGRNLFGRVPLAVLRRHGAFFSPAHLAERLAARLAALAAKRASVIDPACGAGDLLLAYARHLPVSRTLSDTVGEWSEVLHGFDVHSEFVSAAKARLVLLAMARGAKPDSIPEGRKLFPRIRQADFLAAARLASAPDCVIINPPYQARDAGPDCSWAAGSVTSAAVFIDHCLALVPIGCTIAALLPDVLRSGSRYAQWRREVERRAKVSAIERLGVFNATADIDVFVTTLARRAEGRAPRRRIWAPPPKTKRAPSTLSALCDVRVGPVVPFRDEEVGPSCLYVTTTTAAPWETIQAKARRKFDRKTFVGPFVVVRRTSRTGDLHRAVGTIVRGAGPIAIENHLLVLLPTEKTLAACRRILRVLKDPRTTEWLDQRICCRHLTTSALAELPLWPSSRK